MSATTGGIEVASLFASLGLNVNNAQWALGTSKISEMQARMRALQAQGAFFSSGRWRQANGRFMSDLDRAGLGIQNLGKQARGTGVELDGMWKLVTGGVALYGIQRATKAAIGFNSSMEDARYVIAGMLAMAKKTDLNDQLSQADQTLANLQRRAMTLPGTTMDYVQTLSQITQPVSDAGGSMQELEDLTVRAVVASRALKIDTAVGARDIDQAIRGLFRSVDQLTGKVLGAQGYKGEEGRARFNALSAKQRLAELNKAFGSKQIDQLGEAQGKTFSGLWSTFGDNIQISLGKIALPLFEQLKVRLTELNKWFDSNKAKVNAFARAVGSRLATAFDALVAAFKFVTDHAVFFEGVLIGLGVIIGAFAIQAAINWAIAFWPITLAVAAIAALRSAIHWLQGDAEDTKDTFESWIPGLTTIRSELDQIRNGKVSPGQMPGAGSTSANARPVLRDFDGNPIDAAWMQRVGSASYLGDDAATDAQDKLNQRRAALRAMPPRVDIGAATSAPYRPTPARPAGTMAQPAPVVQVKPPQVNVVVTGNMPADWIDAKIDTKIQDHHETTLNNAAHALQADDDE